METYLLIIVHVGFALWFWAGYKIGKSRERRRWVNARPRRDISVKFEQRFCPTVDDHLNKIGVEDGAD